MSELSDTICNDMEKVRDRRKSSALPPTGMTEKNIR